MADGPPKLVVNWRWLPAVAASLGAAYLSGGWTGVAISVTGGAVLVIGALLWQRHLDGRP